MWHKGSRGKVWTTIGIFFFLFDSAGCDVVSDPAVLKCLVPANRWRPYDPIRLDLDRVRIGTGREHGHAAGYSMPKYGCGAGFVLLIHLDQHWTLRSTCE